jgi:hypothetical protein
MTKFELYGENFIVDGDKVKSKLKEWNSYFEGFAWVHAGEFNFGAELLIVAEAIRVGAVVTSGDYLSYLQNPPGTVY